MPARQAFVVELVGKDELLNAIALSSSWCPTQNDRYLWSLLDRRHLLWVDDIDHNEDPIKGNHGLEAQCSLSKGNTRWT